MKRLLIIVFTITPLFVCAQKYSVRRYQDRIIAAQAQARDSIMKSLNITASGAYEKTDTIPDCLLFKRVFDASCEWAKTDSRVNAEIDYGGDKGQSLSHASQVCRYLAQCCMAKDGIN